MIRLKSLSCFIMATIITAMGYADGVYTVSSSKAKYLKGDTVVISVDVADSTDNAISSNYVYDSSTLEYVSSAWTAEAEAVKNAVTQLPFHNEADSQLIMNFLGTSVFNGRLINFTFNVKDDVELGEVIDVFGPTGGNYTSSNSISIEIISLFTAVADPETPGDFDANEDEDSIIPFASLIANDINVDADGNEVTRDITVDSVQDASAGISSVVIDGSDVVVTPVPDFYGPVTFTYTASVDASDVDGAGTVTSTATVSLTFRSVNDAPVLTQPDDVEVLEDAAPEVITLVATDVETALEDLVFTAESNDESLVTTSVTGDQLTLTFVGDAFGDTTVDVTVTDEGGLTDTKSFAVTVTPVNDVPSFTAGGNQTIIENNDTPQVITGWATDISAGPANESDQTVNFVVVATNPTIFTEEPAISPDGTLTYTINPDTVEVTDRVSLVSVRIKDDGGILNGGVDTSAVQQFTITATFENDVPVVDASKITVSPDVIEDSSDATSPTVVTVDTGAFIDEEDGDISTSATFQWQVSIDGGAWSDITGATTATLDGATRANAATGFTIYYSVKCLVSVTDQAHGLTANTVVYGDEPGEMDTTVQIGNEPPKVVQTTPGNEIAVVVNELEEAIFNASFSDKDNAANTGDNGISKIKWTVWSRVGNTGDFTEITELVKEDTYTAVEGGAQIEESAFTYSPDQNSQLHDGSIEYQVRAVGYDGLGVPSTPFVWNVTVKDVNSQPALGETTVTVAVGAVTRPTTDAVTTSTLVATVDPKATDEDEEDADSLIYTVNWYDSEDMDNSISFDEFGGTPTRLLTYDSFLTPANTFKNRTYVAVVTVRDESSADNAVAEGSVSDSIDVINTAPTVGTVDAGQVDEVTVAVVTEQQPTVTRTLIQLTTDNALSDDDEDAIAISSPAVQTGLGTVSVVNGGIEYVPGTDYGYLTVGESETVTVSYSVSDDEETSSVTPTIQILVNGVNDVPVVQSIAVEAQDASGNKVSTSDPLLVEQVAATILATDIDQADTSLTGTAAWTLTRKDGTSANYTDTPIAVTNGVDFSSVVTLADLGIIEFAKDDKLTVVVTVNDGTVDSSELSKNFTIGNPSWFPTVDVMELAPTDGKAVMAVTVAVTFADAITSEDIVTVYAGISENDAEIRPVDYLAADWGTEVKGFKSGTTIAVSSLKIYENGTYQNVEYNTDWTLTVDQYEPASVIITKPAPARGVVAPIFEFDLSSSAAYKFEVCAESGSAIDGGTVINGADEDGAVATDYTVTYAFAADVKPGDYTLKVWAINPDGSLEVAEVSSPVTVGEPVDPTVPPAVVGGLKPGTDLKSAPHMLGTLATTTSKMDVNFTWESSIDAVYYGLCIMKADGSVVYNEVVGTSLGKEIALPAGKYGWAVISWNGSGNEETPGDGYASWSELKWIQIDSPDQEENGDVTTPGIVSATLIDGVLTVTVDTELPEGATLDVFLGTTYFVGKGVVDEDNRTIVTVKGFMLDETLAHNLYIMLRQGAKVGEWVGPQTVGGGN